MGLSHMPLPEVDEACDIDDVQCVASVDAVQERDSTFTFNADTCAGQHEGRLLNTSAHPPLCCHGFRSQCRRSKEEPIGSLLCVRTKRAVDVVPRAQTGTATAREGDTMVKRLAHHVGCGHLVEPGAGPGESPRVMESSGLALVDCGVQEGTPIYSCAHQQAGEPVSEDRRHPVRQLAFRLSPPPLVSEDP
ncbi:hypothetical protein NDU88_007541 [Pleurodeles waltl]|uniref:Uncharacterized protein n=1 Tax=Pleurodeles waltl TaxID=8319 RepID=A0AAV7PUA9_PLEWA|nr:hypothetical protein NDU88_007541 [Pleurodeles waltl]